VEREIRDYLIRYPVLQFAGAFEGDGVVRFAESVSGNVLSAGDEGGGVFVVLRGAFFYGGVLMRRFMRVLRGAAPFDVKGADLDLPNRKLKRGGKCLVVLLEYSVIQ